MAKKKQEPMEFRYYDIPQDEPVLVLAGESWKRTYGAGAPYLHFHNVLEIGYCHYGKGHMVYEKEKADFTGGMISVIPKNMPHNTVSEDNSISYWEFLFVNVERFLTDDLGKDIVLAGKAADRINARYLLFSEEESPETAALIKEIIQEYHRKPPYYKEVTIGLVYALLMLLSRKNKNFSKKKLEERKSSIEHIKEALEYIEDYYNRQLQVIDLAKTCHMSETHFRRTFVHNMNMTPVEYLNMIRIQKACDLLYRTDQSMEMIADKVGFQTVSTFNRNFRHFIGNSPYQWKKSRGYQDDKVREYKIAVYNGWR